MTSVKIEENVNSWDKLEVSAENREKIWTKNRTFLGDVWFRFRKKPTAIVGFVVIVLVVLFSVLGPNLMSHTYDEQNLDFVNIPPFFNAYKVNDGYVYVTSNMKAVEVSKDGKLINALERIKDDTKNKVITFKFKEDVIKINYSKKPAAVVDENGNMMDKVFMRNKTYLLGSDGLGRDMTARLMLGSKISLIVAFIAAAVNLIIGIFYGGISAYMGGKVDSIMMRIVDIISTLPLTLYVILIMVLLKSKSGLLSIIIALGSVYWVSMARVVRGEILSLKERDFVYAAKTIGSSTWTILTRHLIPNAMGPILVTVTMLIPSAIFMEAFLSFIGLGVAAPMASLGTMCNDAIETLRILPYQLFIPSLVICIIMFAFNFVGDGLRDALDPKLKR